jgi:hypothetical protein
MHFRYRSILRASRASAVFWSFVAVLVLVGCSSPDAAPPPLAVAKECVAGELKLPDGRCQPAGLPLDMPCAPGELALEDGTCQPAGVPPEACGQGFEPDGKQGCEPILPAETCMSGQMAVLGETTCREVAPCGDGTWGDIPIEADTLYVDQSYPGNDSNGTAAKPWKTIQAAVTKAKSGAIVAVAAGEYAEDVLIQGKPVRLWGRCPGMVTIAGAGVQPMAVRVLGAKASGAEVRDIAITGMQAGMVVSGATGVLLERVWIHGALQEGLVVIDQLGPTSVALRGSLIDQNHRGGVVVWGAKATLEGTVVRATKPDAQGMFGTGLVIYYDPDTQERANVTVRGCLVEENHQIGVTISGADALIEATVIRDTQPMEQTQDGVATGLGIAIDGDFGTKERSNVTVRACLIEESHYAGVGVKGAEALIEATVIRATQPDAKGESGRGIEITDNPLSKERANVTVRACLIEENHDVGVGVSGVDALIEATVIRATQPNEQGENGWGIAVQYSDATNERANVTVRACVVEESHDAGVRVIGADALIEATVIRATQLNAQVDGSGIIIGHDPEAGERANVTVRACQVEQNYQCGVLVQASDAMIESTVIRATQPDLEGKLGRGIQIQGDPGTKERASVTVRGCLVEQNHEMGVYVLVSDATIQGTVVRATQTDLSGQNGIGIAVLGDPDASDVTTAERASMTVRECLVEQNHGAGIYAFLADGSIDATVISDTEPMSDGRFGDGITASISAITIQDTRVTRNRRAGIANFASQVVVSSTTITCNAFDLEGENYQGVPFIYDGSGGWTCSRRGAEDCTELDECRVLTTGIESLSQLPSP